MTISELTLTSNDLVPVRRFEVFTGSGRRREWPPEEKARIFAESCEAGETVCAVARRYALSPQQLFAWRRVARQPSAEATASESLFVPAVVAASLPEPVAQRPRRARKKKAVRDVGVIELEIDGLAMRVGRGADTRDGGCCVCLYDKRVEDGGKRVAEAVQRW
ncbi:IS66-like element accessory protein TnpA [Mesorhizobium muleiense]|uniref:IS66-like element accessory protein TnpA n=1 Tax=Mesorhizobium muleiense TaxID=1004279 RepID=UPI001F15F69D|nr:transposase [Mesorhizobium muleiense]MCF6109007.1 transposase [Mesorhizobium muleiense]